MDPETIAAANAELVCRGLPHELADKITQHHSLCSSPTAAVIAAHYNAHPELAHWEVPRRFGNFILDDIVEEHLCCCGDEVQTSRVPVVSYCTMCRVGLCAEHIDVGCWCNILLGLGDRFALCSVLRTSAYVTGRYALHNPVKTFYTREFLQKCGLVQ